MVIILLNICYNQSILTIKFDKYYIASEQNNKKNTITKKLNDKITIASINCRHSSRATFISTPMFGSIRSKSSPPLKYSRKIK